MSYLTQSSYQNLSGLLGDVNNSAYYQQLAQQQQQQSVSAWEKAYLGIAFQQIPSVTQPTKKGETTMFQTFKEYVSKHKDVFYTIAVILLADHFLFKGAFKDKITKIVNNALDKAESKLS